MVLVGRRSVKKFTLSSCERSIRRGLLTTTSIARKLRTSCRFPTGVYTQAWYSIILFIARRGRARTRFHAEGGQMRFPSVCLSMWSALPSLVYFRRGGSGNRSPREIRICFAPRPLSVCVLSRGEHPTYFYRTVGIFPGFSCLRRVSKLAPPSFPYNLYMHLAFSMCGDFSKRSCVYRVLPPPCSSGSIPLQALLTLKNNRRLSWLDFVCVPL